MSSTPSSNTSFYYFNICHKVRVIMNFLFQQQILNSIVSMIKLLQIKIKAEERINTYKNLQIENK